jgi:hypothetical protein
MHILYGHSLTYWLSFRVEGNYGRESLANQAKHQGIPNGQTHLPSSSTSGSTTALTHIVLPLSNSRSYRRWRRRTRLDVVQSKGLPWSPSALPPSHMSESRVFFRSEEVKNIDLLLPLAYEITRRWMGDHDEVWSRTIGPTSSREFLIHRVIILWKTCYKICSIWTTTSGHRRLSIVLIDRCCGMRDPFLV